MVAQGDTSRFPLSSPYCARRRSAGSSITLAFLPASSSVHVHICLCLSLFFLLLFLLEIRASHTAGRKSRNRLAGNPPLVRDLIDLVAPRQEEGSARSIGEVLAMSLSCVAHVRTYISCWVAALYKRYGRKNEQKKHVPHQDISWSRKRARTRSTCSTI